MISLSPLVSEFDSLEQKEKSVQCLQKKKKKKIIKIPFFAPEVIIYQFPCLLLTFLLLRTLHFLCFTSSLRCAPGFTAGLNWNSWVTFSKCFWKGHSTSFWRKPQFCTCRTIKNESLWCLVVLLCVLLCAARGADPAADQAPPAAGGAQQPAGTHCSSACGPGHGGAKRQGQQGLLCLCMSVQGGAQTGVVGGWWWWWFRGVWWVHFVCSTWKMNITKQGHQASIKSDMLAVVYPE